MGLWFFSESLDLNVFSQNFHGIETPSILFASMCFSILLFVSSFSHTLHLYNTFPFSFFFDIFSINYIFEKEIVQGPQKQCSQVKNKNLENLENQENQENQENPKKPKKPKKKTK